MILDVSKVNHHPVIEELVEVLCNKTQNTDKSFFRNTVAYFISKMAASMRASVITKDRGEIPINSYVLNLATSGFGKGHSVRILESEVFHLFEKKFLHETMPAIAEKNLYNITVERHQRTGENIEEIENNVKKEYERAGVYPFTFDSGTTPAIKQLRHKLLMAGIGSINLEIDEIGSNLLNSSELLVAYLELYDQGLIKQKLTKNTVENQRAEEINGKTPTNLLLFGTPSKLLDGGATEDMFYTFLEAGYARRCLFGYGQQNRLAYNSKSPEEIYRLLTEPTNDATIEKWANHFEQLADDTFYNWKIFVEDREAIELLRYKIACEKAAEKLPEFAEIKRSELSHRFFKALKLAGALAFVDGVTILQPDHLNAAIKLVEESGEAFQIILNREKAYVKLAKYIAEVGTAVTHADLNEALPFYKTGIAARNEMMTLATAWAYKQHILIKKHTVDSIEFFEGETLEEADLEKCIVSFSDHLAYNYKNVRSSWKDLKNLVTLDGYHWANHHFDKGHRSEENAIRGFNLLVVDVDSGTSVKLAQRLLRDYTYLLYTTKRHTPKENRFRIIFPINYNLYLDKDEYKEFMNNFLRWLPFKSDASANQRSKKWETCSTSIKPIFNDGDILDVLQFIPRTFKNEQYIENQAQIANLDLLGKWFLQHIKSGNRNNMLHRYGMALRDSGHNLTQISKLVHKLNEQIDHPLPVRELETTVLASIARRMRKAKTNGQ